MSGSHQYTRKRKIYVWETLTLEGRYQVQQLNWSTYVKFGASQTIERCECNIYMRQNAGLSSPDLQ